MKKRTIVSRFWGLDPERLEKLTLWQLHILLLERDYRESLPKSKSEAIQILSRDWRNL